MHTLNNYTINSCGIMTKQFDVIRINVKRIEYSIAVSKTFTHCVYYIDIWIVYIIQFKCQWQAIGRFQLHACLLMYAIRSSMATIMDNDASNLRTQQQQATTPLVCTVHNNEQRHPQLISALHNDWQRYLQSAHLKTTGNDTSNLSSPQQ